MCLSLQRTIDNSTMHVESGSSTPCPNATSELTAVFVSSYRSSSTSAASAVMSTPLFEMHTISVFQIDNYETQISMKSNCFHKNRPTSDLLSSDVRALRLLDD